MNGYSWVIFLGVFCYVFTDRLITTHNLIIMIIHDSCSIPWRWSSCPILALLLAALLCCVTAASAWGSSRRPRSPTLTPGCSRTWRCNNFVITCSIRCFKRSKSRCLPCPNPLLSRIRTTMSKVADCRNLRASHHTDRTCHFRIQLTLYSETVRCKRCISVCGPMGHSPATAEDMVGLGFQLSDSVTNAMLQWYLST